MPEREPGPNAIAYSVRDAARVSGLGKTTLYKLAGLGKLRLIHVSARRTLVDGDSLRAFLSPKLSPIPSPERPRTTTVNGERPVINFQGRNQGFGELRGHRRTIAN